MGTLTNIPYVRHTFNPWVGCERVSAGCEHCYAEIWAKRAGWPELWQGERRRTKAASWKKPRQWNAQAADEGVRRRVLCSSLADVFDDTVPPMWRLDLWDLILDTPRLDWCLLTKAGELGVHAADDRAVERSA